MKTVDDGV